VSRTKPSRALALAAPLAPLAPLALFALFALFVLSGCGPLRTWIVGKPLPARELYRLSFPDSVTNMTPSRAPSAWLRGSIGVEPYVTPGLYGQANIVYRVNDNAYGSYDNREWALPLGDMLGMFTAGALLRWPLSAEPAIYDPPTRRAQSYLWRATVREFDEIDRKPDVYAAVRIDASLVRATDDSLLWTDSYRAERIVFIKPGMQSPEQMSAVVSTLSGLATEAIETLVRRAESRVGSGTAGAAQRPR
jgi:ABC-type uncharacterized transport system auxiliary subunit